MSASVAVRDRPLTSEEVEQFRLLLSTYKDGSGQRLKAPIGYMPDYLGFERVTAMVLGGYSNEDKGIFDVAIPYPDSKPWGVSCKMTVSQPSANQAWFMEMSNSAKKLSDAQADAGIRWVESPELAGPKLIETVHSWHLEVQSDYDLPASKYLLLVHDRQWKKFEIASFSLNLIVSVSSRDVQWRTEGGRPGAPSSVAGYIEHPITRREHRLWQWFANSGGQLKYYPPMGWEEWRSGPFELEDCPIKDLRAKVEEYWPGMWPDVD